MHKGYPKTNIQLITLDLDDTLWDTAKTIGRAEEALRSWLKSEARDAYEVYQSGDMGAMRAKVVERHPEHRHDLSFLRRTLLAEVMRFAGYADATAEQLAAEGFAIFFDHRNQVQFFPGAVDVLRYLSQLYPIIALTNGNADVKRAGIADYLVDAISSADVGFKKPHAAMFEAALKKRDIAAPYAVHIGDNILDDITGAANAGMHSVWVDVDHIKGGLRPGEGKAVAATQSAPGAVGANLPRAGDLQDQTVAAATYTAKSLPELSHALSYIESLVG